MSEEKNKSEIIEGALLGGAIGAALGELLSGKGKDTLVSSLIGAAIGASIQAIAESKETDVPVLYEENGKLYNVYPNGKKVFVKEIQKNKKRIPRNFTID